MKKTTPAPHQPGRLFTNERTREEVSATLRAQGGTYYQLREDRFVHSCPNFSIFKAEQTFKKDIEAQSPKAVTDLKP